MMSYKWLLKTKPREKEWEKEWDKEWKKEYQEEWENMKPKTNEIKEKWKNEKKIEKLEQKGIKKRKELKKEEEIKKDKEKEWDKISFKTIGEIIQEVVDIDLFKYKFTKEPFDSISPEKDKHLYNFNIYNNYNESKTENVRKYLC
jgi:hypothetical protein